ncbi:MAG: threonine-phosphate decarboxylase [Verrucomicrobiota bacterium]|jgi:histidinol-phosphate/aromatic aminotransferase/cobyric acid decarboxylase-like protein
MPLNLFKSEERQHSPSVFQVAEAAGHSRVVDFCYLSNKFFPTPEIIARLGEGLEDIVRNYPSMQTEQSELAAALTGFESQHILVGNGASELIHLVAARLGSRWLMPYPSYMEYENVIRDFNKHLHLHQLAEAENFEVNIPRLLAEIEAHDIDAIVLPNPNSPTGRKIAVEGLLTILTRCAHLKAIVIDESFIEFTSVERAGIPTLRSRLAQFPNLIIIRSLGKDFGVCGLRLGLVATSNLPFLGELRRFLPIWNISPLAERFLRLCLEHKNDYETARIQCIHETQRLAKRLAAIPQLHVFETWSNFILFKLLHPKVTSVQLRDHLLTEHGFYVRDCSRKLGLDDKFIRVGTHLPAANDRLVEVIAAFCAVR